MTRNDIITALPDYTTTQANLLKLRALDAHCTKTIATLTEQHDQIKRELRIWDEINAFLQANDLHLTPAKKAEEDDIDGYIETLANAGITAEQHETMTDAEVQIILNEHRKEDPICGHYTVEQVQESLFQMARKPNLAGNKQ